MRELKSSRRFAVLLTVLLACAIPALAQATPKPDPTFDVATIKPNASGYTGLRGIRQSGRSFTATNASLIDLMGFAYDVQKRQVLDGPEWMAHDRYDFYAVTNGESVPTLTQVRIMVAKLLEDRFALKFHHAQRELPAFVLTVQKPGLFPKTQETGPMPINSLRPAPGGWTVTMRNASTRAFAAYLQMVLLDRPVVDQTGLNTADHFDFKVTFAPDDTQFNGHPDLPLRRSEGVELAPPLFDAIRDQLGLKLESKKAMVDVLLIDHVEKPSEN